MSIEIEPSRRRELEYYGVTIPPTQDELPYDDGIPMETPRHAAQMRLLIESLELHWSDRQDFFVGGNMFVYFSLRQARNQDFRGPDFFVVLGVPRKERKSWVVWEEGKSLNLVIELISESTATRDKGEKKQIYQDQLRVPEYVWFDPFTTELAGFTAHNGFYEPIEPDDRGRLTSEQLKLTLNLWEGTYQSITARWLRWETPEGILLPTAQEVAEQERQRAEQERQRANRLAERLKAMGLDPDQVE
jgi:Uma2 family endonuclease